ncbi:hypothetical protein GCM10027169_16860 [Gordonia jinhuaensis]|uniref:Uncharacterized protein n=1 Tax=Gordonia jinhuaensis TaxID=1517702 RepID=A0A916TJQ4_9ACTN|nr:hypothetical protein [Gordonia jinhuaensis]GGB47875.1 hypothetical protein GCM10011489_38840 [Gordonia jinhuaensis]
MADEYGKWIREPRTADCPTCNSDSMGVRRLDKEAIELRRCDEGHEFEAQAYVTSSQSDATRFDGAV